MKRNRFLYAGLALLTILLGLMARRYAAGFPELLNLLLGDALWAMMMYWGLAFLLPTLKINKLAGLTILFCFLVEISQLYQADWINAIRASRLGGLVLGQGFLWTDFIAYSLGVGTAVLCEVFWIKNKNC